MANMNVGQRHTHLYQHTFQILKEVQILQDKEFQNFQKAQEWAEKIVSGMKECTVTNVLMLFPFIGCCILQKLPCRNGILHHS